MDIIGFTLRFIKNHNKLVKSLIDGKPVWVISNGKVKTAECMKNSITANDLMFKLRAAGIYEIKTVKRAVFETKWTTFDYSITVMMIYVIH